nr:hypothetical protein Iba_chr06aCG15670 [Ipomoea batatas]
MGNEFVLSSRKKHCLPSDSLTIWLEKQPKRAIGRSQWWNSAVTASPTNQPSNPGLNTSQKVLSTSVSETFTSIQNLSPPPPQEEMKIEIYILGLDDDDGAVLSTFLTLSLKQVEEAYQVTTSAKRNTFWIS